MSAESSIRPSTQAESNRAELNDLVSSLSRRWNLGLQLSQRPESPQSHRDRCLIEGGESAVKCITWIKYLYFKHTVSLLSTLQTFETSAVLLRDSWDSEPVTGTLPVNRRRQLLGYLRCFLESTIQRVGKTRCNFYAHNGPNTLDDGRNNSEIKSSNEDTMPLTTESYDGSIFPVDHTVNPGSSKDTLHKSEMGARALIALIDSIPVVTHPLENDTQSTLDALGSPSLPGKNSQFPAGSFGHFTPCQSPYRENSIAGYHLENVPASVRSSRSNHCAQTSLVKVAENHKTSPENTIRGKGNLIANDSNQPCQSNGVFPELPQCLEKASFYVRYEITRIFLHTGVDIPHNLKLPTSPQLQDYDVLWRYLKELPCLSDMRFPERASDEAWEIASNDVQNRSKSVCMTASMSIQHQKGEPSLRLTLQPLKIEQTSRLERRFGSDRFLEIQIPSLAQAKLPGVPTSRASLWRCKTNDWIFSTPHSFLGRMWQWFFTDVPTRKTASKPSRGEEISHPVLHCHYFFATTSLDFQEPLILPTGNELVGNRANLDRNVMLRWLIPFEMNESQSYLKLFSRISFGVKSTRESIELQQHQIIPMPNIESADGIDMNDGCGRLSKEMARAIRDKLDSVDLPSAYQGRIGGAKGLWLIDTRRDSPAGIWIEIYKSQEKWLRDTVAEGRHSSDPAHRTFEVVSVSKSCKPAKLTKQFILLLEHGETVPGIMRDTISNLLIKGLESEVGQLRAAMEDPQLLRLWIWSTCADTRERLQTRLIPYLGGLPETTEEQVNMMLDAGFQPKESQIIQAKVRELFSPRLESVVEKLHIHVARSTYVLIGVDFDGYLEEDEIHLTFSKPFVDENTGESWDYLDGKDVLIARSPAHLPTDIQRVKARFVPELMCIKDVALFSVRGRSPLANKLSGGDYDGDHCWIFWDEILVNNFKNSPELTKSTFDKERYLTEDKATYAEIVAAERDPIMSFLGRSFAFNTQPDLLGKCTNYKDQLCRSGYPLGSQEILRLSFLIAKLVDGHKHGYALTRDAWNDLRREVETTNRWSQSTHKSAEHIIDYLQTTAREAKNRVLTEFYQSLPDCYPYDADLVSWAKDLRNSPTTSTAAKLVLTQLKDAIEVVYEKWCRMGAQGNGYKGGVDFGERVSECFLMWQNIEPAEQSCHAQMFPYSWRRDPEHGPWALLKASVTFDIYHHTGVSFPWWMCGKQLCFLKALPSGFRAVSNEMYPMFKPNVAVVKRMNIKS